MEEELNTYGGAGLLIVGQKRRPKQVLTERVCARPGCRTKLTSYNRNGVCSTCATSKMVPSGAEVTAGPLSFERILEEACKAFGVESAHVVGTPPKGISISEINAARQFVMYTCVRHLRLKALAVGTHLGNRSANAVTIGVQKFEESYQKKPLCRVKANVAFGILGITPRISL